MRHFLACLFALVPALGSAAMQKGSVEVTEMSGEVTLIDAQGNRTPATKGAVFQEGVSIETGKDSTASLTFSNGATMSVVPNSLVALKTFSQVVSPDTTIERARNLPEEPTPSVVHVEVYKGSVGYNPKKLNPGSTHSIKTPVGTIRYRG